MSDYQSPSSGQKGDCSVTLKRRRVGGKTEVITMRGPCSGGKPWSVNNAWESLKRTMKAAQKARKGVSE
jgi:hypothetical protein